MKRIMLICVMILCLVPVSGWAEEETVAAEPEYYIFGDFTYILLEDGTAEIKKYTGTKTDVVIPYAVDGHPVTRIGDHALQGWPDQVRITSVALPEGIRTIGNYAFATSLLSSVDLPEGIETIGEFAFSYCNLTTVELPESLVSIGENAFTGTDLTEITLPRNLAELGGPRCFGSSLVSITVSPDNPYWHVVDGFLYHKEDACLFLYPSGLELTACEIPEGTGIIGKGAFAGNADLVSVTVPEGVTVIEASAFDNCRKLSEIALPESLREIKMNAFYGCPLTSLSLPEGLVCLGDFAFRRCCLTDVSLPSTLTDIGANPFCECDELCEIIVSENNPEIFFEHGTLCDRNEGILICFAPGSTEADCRIPNGISVIGAYAFYMTPIRSLIIPEGVAEIREKAFEGCYLLNEVVLPGSVRSIGNESFAFCSFSSIDLPEGLVFIGKEAFVACELRSVSISSTVREIVGNPFCECDLLTSITVAPDSPYFESIGGALIDKMDKRLICCPEGLRYPSYEIPAGVRIIGYEAFLMTQTPCEIIVPEGVTTLEDRCFAYCFDVDIYLPASLYDISPSAFYDQGRGGPILHVVDGSTAEAYGKEKELRCVLQEAQ